MKKLFKIIGVLIVSLVLVFGVIEVGSLVYDYYISKGFREDTSSFLTFFGLGISIVMAILGVAYLQDEKII